MVLPTAPRTAWACCLVGVPPCCGNRPRQDLSAREAPSCGLRRAFSGASSADGIWSVGGLASAWLGLLPAVLFKSTGYWRLAEPMFIDRIYPACRTITHHNASNCPIDLRAENRVLAPNAIAPVFPRRPAHHQGGGIPAFLHRTAKNRCRANVRERGDFSATGGDHRPLSSSSRAAIGAAHAHLPHQAFSSPRASCADFPQWVFTGTSGSS